MLHFLHCRYAMHGCLVACMPFVSFPGLLVLVVLRSLVLSIAEPAEKSVWTSLAPADHVALFLGIQHTVRGVSQTVGTFTGTFLASSWDVHAPYLLIGICHVLIAIEYYSNTPRLHVD